MEEKDFFLVNSYIQKMHAYHVPGLKDELTHGELSTIRDKCIREYMADRGTPMTYDESAKFSQTAEFKALWHGVWSRPLPPVSLFLLFFPFFPFRHIYRLYR